MQKAKFYILLLFILTACSSVEHSTANSLEELKKQLQSIMKDSHVPGLSIAIVENGKKWTAGIGTADVSRKQPATANTLFRIGSISKGFVSLSILQLVEQGKLSLLDTLHDLAPEVWFENKWEKNDPIRIVNLLEHTTGWDDIHLREYALEAPSSMGLLEAFNYDHTSRISRWPPNTRMAYCNSGPAVAAYIVEKIVGMRFEDYVSKNLFQPIGMKTATFFEPNIEAATLYHEDGTTSFPYWHLIYRPTGAVNASANDMANYLRFYLNRGTINNKQILPSSAIARMEIPTTTWAAQEGLKAGYGLSNYWNVYDGFVYHGHTGSLDGGHSEMAYLPKNKVGYFFSINSNNIPAFKQISASIRRYLTKNLEKPSIPKVGKLPLNARKYQGWYQPDSPREEQLYFLERLAGLTYIHLKKNFLLVDSLTNRLTYVPVQGMQFRGNVTNKFPYPIATLMLLSPNVEGKFIQTGMGMNTIKRIPSWQALLEIILFVFVLLSLGAIIMYAPLWMYTIFIKKKRTSELLILLLPLIAALSFIISIFIYMGSQEYFRQRLGHVTIWSFSLFLFTIIFALSSLLNIFVLWQSPKVRPKIRYFSMIVTTALVIAVMYLGYWGVISMRTWA